MRFCGGCGAPLAAPEEGERKEVAVLFADICDFTAWVASSDAEDTKDKVDACLKLLADEVAAFDGVVDKFIGDAVMAIFGVPRAHEDDAERAVRAGLGMLAQARSFGQREGLDIRLRVGVHIGDVIASAPDGAPGRAGHNVFGDTVNVASRLEETGEAGAVVVSAEVYEKTKERFTCEELPPVRAKGIKRLLKRYRVVGPKAVRGAVRGVRDLTAPMVGRDAELATIYAAYRAAAQGEGARLVAVVGDAGIGKTRLVEELVAKVAAGDDDAQVLHGRCLGYTAGPAYYPFTEIIKETAGIKDDMSLSGARKRLAAMAERVFGGTKIGDIDVVAVLLELLALAEGGPGGGHDTEQIRDQVFVVMEKFFRSLAAARPLIVRLEDIHWADAATVELVEDLARTLAETRCLFILNSRPAADYTAVGTALLGKLAPRRNFAQITLSDLAKEESRRLVAELLAVEKLSPETRELIVERAAGNPFFVEEIIKVLIEKGILVRRGNGWAATREVTAVDVPDSIGGVLRSRLDRLPQEEKKVIQRAAVVGRVFWQKAVSELMKQQVRDYLVDLERRDFIHQRLRSLFEDDLEYSFKHTLLHETVYNSMLRRVRRELHLQTARWVESNYGDRLEAYLPFIAYHYEMAAERERAGEYYLRGAARAAALFANDNAKELYAKAVHNASAADALRRAYLGWGDVCARTGANEEAIANFNAARGYCAQPLEEAEIHHRIGDVYEKMSAYDKALEHFARARRLIIGGPLTLVHSWLYKSTAWVHYLRGDLEEAFRFAKKAEVILAALEYEGGDADMARAHCCNVLGAILHEQGNFGESRTYYERTLALYEKNGDLFGVGKTLNNIGTVELSSGRYNAAFDYLRRSLDYDERAGNRFGQAISCFNLGDAHAELGDYETAGGYFERYLEINAAIANRLGDGYAYGGLARIAVEENHPAAAEGYYEKALVIFKELGAAGLYRETRLSLAQFLAGQGREEEAADIFRDYRPSSEKDLCISEATAAAFVGRRRPFDDSEREGLATLAARAATAISAEDDRMEILTGAAALAELYGHLGDEENGRAYRRVAMEKLEEVERNISNERRRESLRHRLAAVYRLE